MLERTVARVVVKQLVVMGSNIDPTGVAKHCLQQPFVTSNITHLWGVQADKRFEWTSKQGHVWMEEPSRKISDMIRYVYVGIVDARKRWLARAFVALPSFSQDPLVSPPSA